MSALIYIVAAVALFCLVYFVLPRAIGAYLTFRGKRLITCPETRRPAAVEVDAKHAAYTAVSSSRPELRLKDCSRWPEREDCGQECVFQVRISPSDCLVRTLLTEWYRDKLCVFCGQSCGGEHWFEHKPALLSPEGVTIEAREVRAEQLPDVLATHKAVCWNCHICETFRREYSDIVVDRSYQAQNSDGARPQA